MTLNTSPDVLAAHLSGEAVLLNLSDKSYYRLNETAAAVWSGFENGETREQILKSLLDQYDVDPEQAKSDIERVIDDMKLRRLLIDTSV